MSSWIILQKKGVMAEHVSFSFGSSNITPMISKMNTHLVESNRIYHSYLIQKMQALCNVSCGMAYFSHNKKYRTSKWLWLVSHFHVSAFSRNRDHRDNGKSSVAKSHFHQGLQSKTRESSRVRLLSTQKLMSWFQTTACWWRAWERKRIEILESSTASTHCYQFESMHNL